MKFANYHIFLAGLILQGYDGSCCIHVHFGRSRGHVITHALDKPWTLTQHEQICIMSSTSIVVVVLSASLVELTIILVEGTDIAIASCWSWDGFRAQMVGACTPIEAIEDGQVG